MLYFIYLKELSFLFVLPITFFVHEHIVDVILMYIKCEVHFYYYQELQPVSFPSNIDIIFEIGLCEILNSFGNGVLI